MVITCEPCSGTGAVSGTVCLGCDGRGSFDLTDTAFRGISLGARIAMTGQIWSIILGKLDALQTDITAIKEKIDNMPDDLVAVLQDIHGHVH